MIFRDASPREIEPVGWVPALALLSAVGVATPAVSETYACKATKYCKCMVETGCSGLSKYVSELRAAKCQPEASELAIVTSHRNARVTGASMQLSLREARPYFSDLDWYQSEATEQRGLINLHLDNDSGAPEFDLREMAQGSVNNFVWTMAGQCEVTQ